MRYTRYAPAAMIVLVLFGYGQVRTSDATYTGSTSQASEMSTAALSAPTGVGCRWTSSSTLSASWGSSDSWVDGFRLERAASQTGTYQLAAQSAAPATALTDPAASIGWYRVRSTAGANWVSPASTSMSTSSCAGAITGLMPVGTVQAPSGIAAAGPFVYTSDEGGNRVVRTDGTGTTVVVAGTGAGGYSGDGGPATSATLKSPRGIAVGADGSLYIADAGNNVVRRVSPDGTMSTLAGTGSGGYSGDGGPATNATLKSPVGVSVSATGVVYIADTGNHVIRTVVGGTISTFAGTGSGGYGGDGGPATSARLDSPYDAVAGAGSDVHIADTGNDVLRVVRNGTITTLTGTGSGGCGYAGPVSGAGLSEPRGLAWDGTNARLVVADHGNDCIRAITAGNIATVAGTGNGGYTGDGGAAIAATLKSPAAVAVTSTGDVVIADAGNNVARRVLTP